MRRLLFLIQLTVLLLITGNNVLSAQDATQTDSAKTEAFSEKIQALTRKIQFDAAEDKRNDRESMKQDIIFDLIRKNMQRAKSYLKTGIDTTGIMEAVHKITNWQALANENPGHQQLPTYRDLTVTYNMVLDMQARLNVYKSALDTYKQTLAGFKLRIDSLASDSSMYSLASDSAILKDYLQRLVTMAREVSPTGDLLEKAIKTTSALQTIVDIQVYTLEARKEELELSQRHLYSQMLGREYPDIWQPATENRSFQSIISYSVRKSLLTLRLYAGNNSGKIFLLLLLTALSAVYIGSLKKIYREKKTAGRRLYQPADITLSSPVCHHHRF